jgi:hypothetical protein
LWEADDNGIFLPEKNSKIEFGEIGKKISKIFKIFLP